ncbi:RNA polymerase I-specific transcription initiation factor RRN3 [Violaceomyces palustris]|uniref:RNA polymerase I-specific transcription initiation factor RRN3 n=1 Tax=Violaceomyces palustris TaxID=1673888 RepID=A0ACD0NZ34_9BASI|nr:RNA polymerase I-specific transcription initiation factor RRN3 [Violaceomyces palustris]
MGRDNGPLASSGDGYRQGMYLAFVNNALAEKRAGNLGPYMELVAQFQAPSPTSSTPNTSPTQLRSWLSALSHVVSSLDRSHSQLVENILLLPWATMSEAFSHMWIKFVCSLVSARGEWLTSVLSRAVKGLSYRSDWRALAYAGEPANATTSSAHVPPTRGQIYDRIHLLIRSLLSLIPTLPSSLAPLLVRNFPHKRDRRVVQLVYIRNILKMSEYCTELAEGILGAVVDRAIQLDVEIQVELDELEESEEAEFLDQDIGDPFDKRFDDDGDESDDESDGEEDGQSLSDISEGEDDLEEANHIIAETEGEKAISHVRDLVSKLDSIMFATFEHLNRLNEQYTKPEPGPWSVGPDAGGSKSLLSRRQHLFHTLLAIFARAVLPTFKSRHVQFLLFWFNALDHEFADLFLGVLLTKSLYGGTSETQEGGEEPAIIRAAAASYVASFVSRASYIDQHTCRAVVLNLCAFLDAHMEASTIPEMEVSSAPPGSGAHSVFYAVSQAVFYIFCFRWRDLQLTEDEQAEQGAGPDVMEAEDIPAATHVALGMAGQVRPGQGWAEGLNVVQRAITSPLNPLKYCSPNVVRQFARVAQHTGFLYCYSIIEANNRSGRVRSRQSSGQGLHGSSVSRSDSANTVTGSRRPSPTPQDQDSQSGSDRLEDPPEPASLGTDLEVFFPFDPYKLRTSAMFVEPLYREWSDVAPDEDDSDEGEGEASEDESEEEGEDDGDSQGGSGGLDIPGARTVGSHLAGDEDGDEFARQVEAMSISPYRG